MLREFKFPDVGEGIAEGEIVRWLVKEGDSVKEDQDLLEVETDKALLTLNSPYTGKVTRLHGKEGDIIKVGDVPDDSRRGRRRRDGDRSGKRRLRHRGWDAQR